MTVSEQIIQVIDVLCAKVGIVIDWTSENALPYVGVLCEKLVKYEIGTSIAQMVIFIILSICSIVAAKKLYPMFKSGIEEQGFYDCGWTVGAWFAVAALIIFNIVTICVVGQQVMDIIKCATFPEMYVFEYVRRFINAG